MGCAISTQINIMDEIREIENCTYLGKHKKTKLNGNNQHNIEKRVFRYK
jgi:hypothetical protein